MTSEVFTAQTKGPTLREKRAKGWPPRPNVEWASSLAFRWELGQENHPSSGGEGFSLRAHGGTLWNARWMARCWTPCLAAFGIYGAWRLIL